MPFLVQPMLIIFSDFSLIFARISVRYFGPARYISAHLRAFFAFFTYVFTHFFTSPASGGPNFPPKSV
jgi:hypothetical protein